jgi:succinylglutamic semialdehyde dehydrogenase
MITLNQILKDPLKFRGSFVNGQWSRSHVTGEWKVKSPANHDWVLPELSYDNDEVEKAVDAAKNAWPLWRSLSMDERLNYLKNFAAELDKRKDTLGRIIAIETGKPFDEALAEAGLLSAKINVTIQYGLELVKSQVIEVDAKTRGEIHFKAKGILLIIGPFNFPVHLSHGHIAPALLMGNVCILKPSEKTPYSAQVYMEAAEAAGIPKGVLQLIHGPGDMATRLVRHTEINGVIATCSYEVGAKIQKTLAESPEKIVALEMGGKNAALIWENSNIDELSDALIRSCFLTTGQRCTALSRVYVQQGILGDLVQSFHQKAKELVVSHPFAENPKPFMGPLISEQALEKYLRYSGIAASEGAESVMRPKTLQGTTRLGEQLPIGNYVSPSIQIVKEFNPKSNYQNHEIFGPDVFFCPINSLEEGVRAVNSSYYGLVASVFCPKEKFSDIAEQLEVGLVYHNRPTVGASARLPFGGWKRSGNHRPAGLFAIYACTQAQARVC